MAPSGNGRAPDAIANVNASERETKPHIEATGADGAEIGTGSQQDEVRPPKSGLQRRKRRLHRFGIISLNCLLKKADDNSNHEDGNDSIMDRDDGDNTMDLKEEDG